MLTIEEISNIIQNEDFSKAEELLKKDFFKKDNITLIDFSTKIELILRIAVEQGKINFLKNILSQFQNIDKKILGMALIKSIETNQNEISQLLIKIGADLNIMDDNDNTALKLAIQNEDCAMVKLLLDNGANANQQNPTTKKTMLMLAIGVEKKVNLEILKLLLEHKADPNIVDVENLNAYTYAQCFSGSKEAKEILSKFGANTEGINRLNEKKESLLMNNINNIPYVRRLIQEGIDLNIRNQEGYSALDIALANNEPEIANAIREKTNRNPVANSSNNNYILFGEDCELIKITGHIMGLGTPIEKTVVKIPTLHPSGGEVKIDVEANYSHNSVKYLTKFMKEFVEKNKEQTEEEVLWNKEIAESFQVASDFQNNEGVQAKDLNSRFHASKFTVLPLIIQVETGPDKKEPHAIGVCLYKNYLIYCNRGAGKRKEIRVYKLTDAEKMQINEEWFKKLFPIGKTPDENEIHDLLSEKIASFKRGEYWNETISKDQRHGSCSMANRKTLYEPMLLLKKLERIAKEKTGNDTITDQIKQDFNAEAQHYAKKNYKKFTTYLRDNYIEGFIVKLKNARTNGPKSTYAICLELTKEIIKEHHGQDRSTKRKEKVSGELNRMLKLLEALNLKERIKILIDFEPKMLAEIVRATINNIPLQSLIFPALNNILEKKAAMGDWNHVNKIAEFYYIDYAKLLTIGINQLKAANNLTTEQLALTKNTVINMLENIRIASDREKDKITNLLDDKELSEYKKIFENRLKTNLGKDLIKAIHYNDTEQINWILNQPTSVLNLQDVFLSLYHSIRMSNIIVLKDILLNNRLKDPLFSILSVKANEDVLRGAMQPAIATEIENLLTSFKEKYNNTNDKTNTIATAVAETSPRKSVANANLMLSNRAQTSLEKQASFDEKEIEKSQSRSMHFKPIKKTPTPKTLKKVTKPKPKKS